MNYEPRPLDTTQVALSPALLELMEKLAENTHEVWSATRIAQGWTYGPTRNDAAKTHPGLVPYAELSELEKDLDRGTARETLKTVLLLGYRILDPH
jgi:DNA-binding response OmpR family regulator